ncbi:MAG: hypothetical protein AB1649_10085 [Chloroflexota bacterium]
MDKERTYSPAEICNMFKIAKTTLFRWEAEGRISDVPRKLNDEREYSKKHIKEIADIQIETLKQIYERAAETENESQMEQVHDALTMMKILYLEDLSGLRELAEHNSLSDMVITQLLQKALESTPRERIFKEIVELLYHYVQSSYNK